MSHFSAAETDAARRLIDLALAEDLGATGDITSQATIPASKLGRAVYRVRSEGILAGVPLLELVVERYGQGLNIITLQDDGARLRRGEAIATIAGPVRSLLAVERITLNFLQRLSGIATLTHKYVDAIIGCQARIFDTRKTTPGWRLLEKYAVRQGGGINHRIGLYDAFLIKDNHLAALAPAETAIVRAIAAAREMKPGFPVEIEVDTLEQFDQALACRPEIILLDNMSLDALREAVRRRDASGAGVLLEASGGVNFSTIRGIAETGVDRISVGALTHSAPALDIGLDYEG